MRKALLPALAIVIVLGPPMAHAGRSRCELALDSDLLLMSWGFDFAKTLSPLPNEPYTGSVLGVSRGPILFQLKFEIADVVADSNKVRLRPLSSQDSVLDIFFELENDPAFLSLWGGKAVSGLRSRDGIWLPSVLVGSLQLTHSLSPHLQVFQRALVIEDRETHQMAGFISTSLHLKPNEYRISYGLFRPFRNRGLATDAVQVAIRKLQSTGDRRPITAYVAVTNHSSIAVLESVGFRRDPKYRDEGRNSRYVYY